MRFHTTVAITLASLASPLFAQDCWQSDAFDSVGPQFVPVTTGSYSALTLRSSPTQPESAFDGYEILLPAQSRLTLGVHATSPYAPSAPDSFVYTSQPVPPTTFEGAFFVANAPADQQAWRTNADGSWTPVEYGLHRDP